MCYNSYQCKSSAVLNRTIVILIWAFWLAASFSAHPLKAQSQQVLLIDNFSQFPINARGGEVGAYGVNGGIGLSEIITQEAAFDGTGKTLSFEYDVSQTDSSFAFFVSKFDNLDLSHYHYLSFWIRGQAGAEFLQVQLKNATEVAKVPVCSYLRGGPGTEWRKVVLPLDTFWNLTSRNAIEELVFVAENYQSSENGSALKGKVFIDDIVCGNYFPGYVKIDHFGDKLRSNDTGGNIGEFSQTGDASLYTSEIDTVIHHLEPYALRVDYNNGSSSEYGGVFFMLGGDKDGWSPVFKDLSQYTKLHLALLALSATTNPGNIKLELKSTTGILDQRISGISTQWTERDIPLQDFGITSSNNKIGQFNLVFERSKQEKLSGSLIIDEIEFRAQDFTGPDTAAPQFGALRVNDVVPDQSMYVSSSTKIELPVGNQKLESARLFYRGDTETNWRLWDRNYAQGTGAISWTFDASQLPANSFVALKAVVQNYSGTESSSEIIYLKTAPFEYDIKALFRDSFELFQILRTNNGIYRDTASLDGNHYHPASVATNGMGLVALCIADAMGWIPDAAQQAETTLRTITGQENFFTPARNASGFYAHFLELTNGDRAWQSEYSSIDTGILMAGAMFCKNYFQSNKAICTLVDDLWNSIDWDAAIANAKTGEIYRVFNEDGSGKAGSTTKPFNEYMIVASFAMQADSNKTAASELWDLYYAEADSLPQSHYEDIDLLTDAPGAYLSHFTLQFPLYLSNYFITNENYLYFLANARKADSLWWQKSTSAQVIEWGLGAGSSINASRYHADAINDNLGNIFSPHIIAGFLPVFPPGREHLLDLFNNGKAVYGLPNSTKKVLWRISLDRPDWRSPEIQGVDFATMLFGLAALPEHLGLNFFIKANVITCSITDTDSDDLFPSRFALFQNYPNPFNPETKIRYSLPSSAHTTLEVVDVLGRRIALLVDERQQPGEYLVAWDGTNNAGLEMASGVYLLKLKSNDRAVVRKLVLAK
ncbi:T9SS type A sorting domain-containing protein [candidate division KSB1 bacterium]|nr:T9SS type A sorting domain-containing protein [candidate division KSB1 bacterium]